VGSLRLGTRRSKLALAQAEEVAAALRLVAPGIEVELVPMVTAGDTGSSGSAPPPPGSAGRKGMFVGEIVTALRKGDIDLAVHSAKDLPAEDPEGIAIAAVPERASPFDVMVTRGGEPLEGARVGTGSIRRRAQLSRLRPDVRIEDLRGNVDTRLRRLQDGLLDAAVLAAAGLDRLGIRPSYMRPFNPDEMLPAPGQGALAVQVRHGDGDTVELVKQLDHLPSRLAVEAERGVMAALGGGCDLPLGSLAEARGSDAVRLVAAVFEPGGTRTARAEAEAATPAEAAAAVVAVLLDAGAEDILAAARDAAAAGR
jgi:hydroxymethylbilane synthase